MNKNNIICLLLFSILLFSSSYVLSEENWNDSFQFIVTADMRYYATEKYRTSEHFLGVVEAVRDVGKGTFMISTGDIDPPYAVKEVISQILGDDYPWYPVVGNHEMGIEQDIRWLQQYNKNGRSLPNIVNIGLQGTEELTYSFDWGDCHFAVLNQYFDGKRINGADGDVIPEQLVWLEHDLSATDKKFIFVFGHEPIVSIPDMDNGRIRHQGDSLDKYPKNAFQFHQTLLKYHVVAYLCGHTHSTSYSQINGLWQLDAGHSRGIEEDSAPKVLFRMIDSFVNESKHNGVNENEALLQYFRQNENNKQVKKTLFYSRLVTGVSDYNKINDEQAIQAFNQFYQDFKKGGSTQEKIDQTFWENCEYRKSTFFKLFVGKEKVKLEIYRDDAHGGNYTLRQTLIID